MFHFQALSIPGFSITMTPLFLFLPFRYFLSPPLHSCHQHTLFFLSIFAEPNAWIMTFHLMSLCREYARQASSAFFTSRSIFHRSLFGSRVLFKLFLQDFIELFTWRCSGNGCAAGKSPAHRWILENVVRSCSSLQDVLLLEEHICFRKNIQMCLIRHSFQKRIQWRPLGITCLP